MDASAITALGAVLIAVIGAIFTGLTSLRNGKKLDVVQKAVNGNLTDVQTRVAQLQTTMVDHGVPIPAVAPPSTVEPPEV